MQNEKLKITKQNSKLPMTYRVFDFLILNCNLASLSLNFDFYKEHYAA